SEDHGPYLGDIQGGGVAGGVAAGPEDVELREGLAGTRRQDDVRQGATRDDDARSEGDGEALVEETVILPARDREVRGKGEPLIRLQPHAAPVRREAHADGEEGHHHDDWRETNSPWSEVEEQPEKRDDGDAQAERQGDAFDPVDFRL